MNDIDKSPMGGVADFGFGDKKREEKVNEKDKRAAQDELISALAGGRIDDAKKIIDFGILPRYEIKSCVQDGFIGALAGGQIDAAKKIVDLGILSTNDLKYPHIESPTLFCLKEVLAKGRVDDAKKIMDFGILHRREIESCAQDGLMSTFSSGLINGAKEIIDLGILPRHVIKSCAQDGLKRAFSLGQTSKAKGIIDLGILSADDLKQESIKSSALKGLEGALVVRWVDTAKDFIGLGILSEAEIKPLLQYGLRIALDNDPVDNAKEIIGFGILSDVEIKSSTQEGLERALAVGHIDKAKGIIGLGILSEVEIKSSVRDYLKSTLANGRIDSAKEIIDSGIVSESVTSVAHIVMRIATAYNLSGVEYGVLTKKDDDVLERMEAELHDGSQTSETKESIHREAIACYTDENDPNRIIRGGMRALSKFGVDDDTVWTYLGANGNRHDALQNVPFFLSCVPETEKDKRIAILMFRAGNMGTGMQKLTLLNIMASMTRDVWLQLKTETQYPGQAPSLSDPSSINLLRIQNEIKLIQTPELQEAIRELPADSRVRDYALELLKHPTINVGAIENFVRDPDVFFDSRTGAGEDLDYVDDALSILSPTHSHGDWNAAEARDAIVDGTYDKLNSFVAQSVTWREINAEDNKDALSLKDSLERNAPKTRSELQALFSNEQLKKLDSVFVQQRIDFFVADMRAQCEANQDVKNAILDHVRRKGNDVIQKAIPYYCKHYKKGKPTEQDIHAYQTELEQAKETAEKEQDPSLFWAKVGAFGFLDNMPLQPYMVRISNKLFVSEDTDEVAYLDRIAERTKYGRDILRGSIEEINRRVNEDMSTVEYQMEILPPSNTESATAGSTTGNCDAFGHGKKAHYMINAGTAQLVLRRHGQIIAQSTIVLGRRLFDTGRERERYMQRWMESNGKIGEALGVKSHTELQEFLLKYSQAPKTITLDSVETVSNLSGISREDMMQIIARGADLLGEKDQLFRESFIHAGAKYSFFDGYTNADNRDVTSVPLPYTDNLGARNVLIRGGGEEGAHTEQPIRPAEPDDAFAVALMEEIAFRRSGGESYITGYLPITGELWESAVETKHRGCNPLSFIAHDKKGVPTGYLIAYTRDESEIYITDTATTGTERGVGTRLLMALLQSCATDPELNKKVITMDCRGDTSAPIVASHVDMLEELSFVDSEGRNVKFEVRGPALKEIRKDSLYKFTFTPSTA